MTLRSRMKSWRRRTGLTQAEAALRLGLPLGTWRNWEQGRTRPSRMAEQGLTLLMEEKG